MRLLVVAYFENIIYSYQQKFTKSHNYKSDQL